MKQPTNISTQQLVKLYRQAIQKGLPLEKVEAKVSKKIDRLAVSTKIEAQEEEKRISKIKHRLPKKIRYGALFLPILFITLGLFLLGNAITPIFSYYSPQIPKFNQAQLSVPIPKEEVLDVTPLVIAKTESPGAILGKTSQTKTGPVILDTQLDFTNLTNWFKDDRSEALKKIQNNTMYRLDIPKINLENALVKIGGSNLDENLIAYPGTAFPGELGSPVIFGHSVLRQFYNPKENNPRRYISVFSYIMTLKRGDEIYLTHDGAKYTYKVTEKTDVKPEDTYILAQNYDKRTLKLVTCVPEGTSLRRGVVTAELVSE